MADPKSLQRLLTWLSPAFPVGAFAWSGGLETAIAGKRVQNQSQLQDWITGALTHGSAQSDAVLLAESWRASHDAARLKELVEFTLALAAAAERRKETTALGAAFIEAARAWENTELPEPCPYPVAIGAIAARQGIALEDVTIAFLTAFAQSQVSVALRLIPLGQTEGMQTLAALEPVIPEAAETAAATPLENIGSIAYAAEIAAMRHETQNVRIFRS